MTALEKAPGRQKKTEPGYHTPRLSHPIIFQQKPPRIGIRTASREKAGYIFVTKIIALDSRNLSRRIRSGVHDIISDPVPMIFDRLDVAVQARLSIQRAWHPDLQHPMTTLLHLRQPFHSRVIT